MHEVFYDVLKYSNYKVIFCYKLVFSSKIFSYNKGCWIIFILFILYLTQLAIYLCKKISPLKLYIARYHFGKDLQNKKKDNSKEKMKKAENNINNELTEKIEISPNAEFPPKKRSLRVIKRNKEKNFDVNIARMETKENISRINDNDDLKTPKKPKNSKVTELDEIKLGEKDEFHFKKSKLDNYELNKLEYKDALVLDKRNFIQMYWSVLKREHIIIFTFFFHNDFNLYYAKNAKFIFLLATDMVMNVFFFSDETMNKLYLSYGKYDFVQQIPQIIYSKILSNLIEVILCYFMLFYVN